MTTVRMIEDGGLGLKELHEAPQSVLQEEVRTDPQVVSDQFNELILRWPVLPVDETPDVALGYPESDTRLPVGPVLVVHDVSQSLPEGSVRKLPNAVCHFISPLIPYNHFRSSDCNSQDMGSGVHIGATYEYKFFLCQCPISYITQYTLARIQSPTPRPTTTFPFNIVITRYHTTKGEMW